MAVLCTTLARSPQFEVYSLFRIRKGVEASLRDDKEVIKAQCVLPTHPSFFPRPLHNDFSSREGQLTLFSFVM